MHSGGVLLFRRVFREASIHSSIHSIFGEHWERGHSDCIFSGFSISYTMIMIIYLYLYLYIRYLHPDINIHSFIHSINYSIIPHMINKGERLGR